MSLSPVVPTVPPPMDTSTSVPPYAVALMVVVAVVSVGLLIAIIYYCRKKDNRGELIRESPERDPEQLREQHVAHRHHLQLPDIPTSLASNITPTPSPSIFSRENFVLEVLDDVEKVHNNATNTEANECEHFKAVMTNDEELIETSEQDSSSPKDPEIAAASIISERSDSPKKRPRLGLIGGLRVREHSQADASIAALRGSLCSEQESSCYDGNDVEASTSAGFVIYEDCVGVDDCIEVGNTKEDDIIIGIENENYCVTFDAENFDDEIKNEIPIAKKEFICVVESCDVSASSEQTVSLNTTPTSIPEDNSPDMATNNSSSNTSPVHNIVHNMVSVAILQASKKDLLSQQCSFLSDRQILTTPVSDIENSQTSYRNSLCKGKMDTECVPGKDEDVAVCGIEALDVEGSPYEETVKQLEMTNMTENCFKEGDSARPVKENYCELRNGHAGKCDDLDGKNLYGSEDFTSLEQIAVNNIPTLEFDEFESDDHASISFMSTWTPALPNNMVSMNTSLSVTEMAVSVSQLSLRSDSKLPTTPLSHTSDYTPVYNSRKMGSTRTLE